VKGDKFSPINKHVEEHTWHAIELNKTMFLVDCKWGAVRRKGNRTKPFQPYYFLQPPQIFIYEHFSKDFQFQSKKVDLDKFFKLPRLRYSYFLNDIHCTSHDILTDFHLSNNTEFSLTFTCNSNSSLMDTLLLSGTMYDEDNKIAPNTFLIQKNVAKSFFKVDVALPWPSAKHKSRFFTFNLFTSSFEDRPEWCAQFYFDLSAIKPSPNDDVQPNKLCDAYSIETDVFLLKPTQLYLKLNKKYKFELMLYDALEVVLVELDRANRTITQFEPVDRNRNQWCLTHEVTSKNELVVCAKLNPKSPYISVFGYKVID
jgi:hypothetical protein